MLLGLELRSTSQGPSSKQRAQAEIQLKSALQDFEDLYRRQVQLLIDRSQKIEEESTQKILLGLLEKDLSSLQKALKAAEELAQAKVHLLEQGRLGTQEEEDFLRAQKNLKTYLVLTDF